MFRRFVFVCRSLPTDNSVHISGFSSVGLFPGLFVWFFFRFYNRPEFRRFFYLCGGGGCWELGTGCFKVFKLFPNYANSTPNRGKWIIVHLVVVVMTTALLIAS